VIRVTGPGRRDALKGELDVKGIQTEVYYPRAMHEQECFGTVKEKYPVATRLTQETLALPGLNRVELLQKLEESFV
jgi:dTDP-4-amino-4,6-dideoxygalactose transaminase